MFHSLFVLTVGTPYPPVTVALVGRHKREQEDWPISSRTAVCSRRKYCDEVRVRIVFSDMHNADHSRLCPKRLDERSSEARIDSERRDPHTLFGGGSPRVACSRSHSRLGASSLSLDAPDRKVFR